MRFILGRVGTGKSTMVLNEIKETIIQGFKKPIIYIVPEQFSFEAEKKLIKAVGKNGIIGAQVLSFKRLSYKIFSENNIDVSPISNSRKINAHLLYYA